MNVEKKLPMSGKNLPEFGQQWFQKEVAAGLRTGM